MIGDLDKMSILYCLRVRISVTGPSPGSKLRGYNPRYQLRLYTAPYLLELSVRGETALTKYAIVAMSGVGIP